MVLNLTALAALLFCSYSIIFSTLPTMPFSRRTLIPRGCVGEFVRISFTTPSVSFPLDGTEKRFDTGIKTPQNIVFAKNSKYML
jgi:hypothetical protein